MIFHEDALLKEVTFKAIRSSGSGGQHVNKTSSKIELSFNISESSVLNEAQKERLVSRLKSRLSNNNILLMQCGETRSQHRNKALIIKRFFNLITENLKVIKIRKASRIPRGVKLKRLNTKRLNAQKKVNRKKPNLDS
jgi:ribosome-associated protein